MKFPQQVVILCHCSLTLEHLNQDTWLIVRVSRESLSLFSWDCGISLNQLCHHAACRLETHGQWCHVQQKQVLNLRRAFTSQDSSLDSSAERNCFVWIDRFA